MSNFYKDHMWDMKPAAKVRGSFDDKDKQIKGKTNDYILSF